MCSVALEWRRNESSTKTLSAWKVCTLLQIHRSYELHLFLLHTHTHTRRHYTALHIRQCYFVYLVVLTFQRCCLFLSVTRTERYAKQMYLCNALHIHVYNDYSRANEMSTFTFISVDSKNFPERNTHTAGAVLSVFGFSPYRKLASIRWNCQIELYLLNKFANCFVILRCCLFHGSAENCCTLHCRSTFMHLLFFVSYNFKT